MITVFDKIRLCFYPTLIILFLSSFSVLTFFVTEKLIIRILVIGLSIYFFRFASILFSTIPSKIRSIIILVRKNKIQVKTESFEKYMVAPCGRQVAKISLEKLMRLDIYRSLKKDFPLNLFSKKASKTRIVYYKNGEKIL
jgi:hypothetical protein